MEKKHNIFAQKHAKLKLEMSKYLLNNMLIQKDFFICINVSGCISSFWLISVLRAFQRDVIAITWDSIVECCCFWNLW